MISKKLRTKAYQLFPHDRSELDLPASAQILQVVLGAPGQMAYLLVAEPCDESVPRVKRTFHTFRLEQEVSEDLAGRLSWVGLGLAVGPGENTDYREVWEEVPPAASLAALFDRARD